MKKVTPLVCSVIFFDICSLALILVLPTSACLGLASSSMLSGLEEVLVLVAGCGLDYKGRCLRGCVLWQPSCQVETLTTTEALNHNLPPSLLSLYLSLLLFLFQLGWWQQKCSSRQTSSP